MSDDKTIEEKTKAEVTTLKPQEFWAQEGLERYDPSIFANGKMDRDDLYKNESFIAAAKTMYEMYKGEIDPVNDYCKTDEDFAKWAYQRMSWFNNNLVAMGRVKIRMLSATPEEKVAFLYAMEAFDNTKIEWGKDVGSFLYKGMVTDPVSLGSVVAGIFTGGATTASAQAGKETIKQGIKILSKKAIQTAVRNGAKFAQKKATQLTTKEGVKTLTKETFSKKSIKLGIGKGVKFGVFDGAYTGLVHESVRSMNIDVNGQSTKRREWSNFNFGASALGGFVLHPLLHGAGKLVAPTVGRFGEAALGNKYSQFVMNNWFTENAIQPVVRYGSMLLNPFTFYYNYAKIYMDRSGTLLRKNTTRLLGDLDSSLLRTTNFKDQQGYVSLRQAMDQVNSAVATKDNDKIKVAVQTLKESVENSKQNLKAINALSKDTDELGNPIYAYSEGGYNNVGGSEIARRAAKKAKDAINSASDLVKSLETNISAGNNVKIQKKSFDKLYNKTSDILNTALTEIAGTKVMRKTAKTAGKTRAEIKQIGLVDGKKAKGFVRDTRAKGIILPLPGQTMWTREQNIGLIEREFDWTDMTKGMTLGDYVGQKFFHLKGRDKADPQKWLEGAWGRAKNDPAQQDKAMTFAVENMEQMLKNGDEDGLMDATMHLVLGYINTSEGKVSRDFGMDSGIFKIIRENRSRYKDTGSTDPWTDDIVERVRHLYKTQEARGGNYVRKAVSEYQKFTRNWRFMGDWRSELGNRQDGAKDAWKWLFVDVPSHAFWPIKYIMNESPISGLYNTKAKNKWMRKFAWGARGITVGGFAVGGYAAVKKWQDLFPGETCPEFIEQTHPDGMIEKEYQPTQLKDGTIKQVFTLEDQEGNKGSTIIYDNGDPNGDRVYRSETITPDQQKTIETIDQKIDPETGYKITTTSGTGPDNITHSETKIWNGTGENAVELSPTEVEAYLSKNPELKKQIEQSKVKAEGNEQSEEEPSVNASDATNANDGGDANDNKETSKNKNPKKDEKPKDDRSFFFGNNAPAPTSNRSGNRSNLTGNLANGAAGNVANQVKDDLGGIFGWLKNVGGELFGGAKDMLDGNPMLQGIAAGLAGLLGTRMLGKLPGLNQMPKWAITGISFLAAIVGFRAAPTLFGQSNTGGGHVPNDINQNPNVYRKVANPIRDYGDNMDGHTGTFYDTYGVSNSKIQDHYGGVPTRGMSIEAETDGTGDTGGSGGYTKTDQSPKRAEFDRNKAMVQPQMDAIPYDAFADIDADLATIAGQGSNKFVDLETISGVNGIINNESTFATDNGFIPTELYAETRKSRMELTAHTPAGTAKVFDITDGKRLDAANTLENKPTISLGMSA